MPRLSIEHAKQHKQRVKGILEIMNQLTRRRKSTKRIGPIRNNNHVLVYDDHEKSASLFATVGEKSASNFSTTTRDGLSLISRMTPIISDISFSHEGFFFFAVNWQNHSESPWEWSHNTTEMKIVSKEIAYGIATLSTISELRAG